MTDHIFDDLEIAASFRGEHYAPTESLRVVADVECALLEEEGTHLTPHVALWDESPPPEGGGFFTFRIEQARKLAEALLLAADHAQRAKDEAERRGWKLVE